MISRPIRLKPSERFKKSRRKQGQPLGGRIDKAVKKFRDNPKSPGLNFEAVKNAAGYFTIRVDRNFRILLKAEVDKDGPYFLLADVRPHDDAY